jgi:hypothetical protein
MPIDTSEYVHPRHVAAFLDAARKYQCHILVRKTGSAALQYFGKFGYAGKLANMKAKTAIEDVPPYTLKGLVCSPLIHLGACKPNALSEWRKSQHLITVPNNGFDDRSAPRGCQTPYVLQTNRDHHHYGCVAWVEYGLQLPRYVHGDYDLYAIVPAGKPYDPGAMSVRGQQMIMGMESRRGLTLPQQVAYEKEHSVVDRVGPLSMEVAMFLNLRIISAEGGIPAGMMVNHGEQVNLGKELQDWQPVVAFLASPRDGETALLLGDRAEHEQFYGLA